MFDVIVRATLPHSGFVSPSSRRILFRMSTRGAKWGATTIVFEGSSAVLVDCFVDIGVQGALVTEVPSMARPDVGTARVVAGPFDVVGTFEVDSAFGVAGPFNVIGAFDAVNAFVAVGAYNGIERCDPGFIGLSGGIDRAEVW
jgi:hypothetical protein